MLGGSETMDGKTIEYGANWDRLSESVTIAENELAGMALTVEDLVGVPSSLQGEVTYARVEEYAGGSETTYFTEDANGKLEILGYSNTHDYSWDETYGNDTVTIQGTSTNYNDANWNWLGGSWSDVYGEGYNSNVVVDGVRIETGSFTSYRVTNGVRDGAEDAPEIMEQSSYTYRFDELTGDMLGGSETRGAITTTYGAGWIVESTVTTVDVTSGNFTQLTPEALALFPSAFVSAIGVADAEGNITADIYTSSQDLGWGVETTYYSVTGTSSSLLGYSMREEFDTDPGTEGLEDLQLAVDAAQLGVDDAQLAVTQAEGMVTSASDDVADREGILAGAQAELAAMVEAEDADAYAAKQLEITGYETDLADAEITKTNAETALSGYQEELTAANAALTSAQDALNAAGDDGSGAEETYTTYFNTDHEWVGNEYANAYGSGSYFRVDVTDDTGAITHQLESGKEFNAGGELVRDWAFKFDPLTGDMLGGSETMDGKTIEYGANWDRLSESVTIAENELAGMALTVEDLVGVPSSLQGEVTYARVTEFDGGGSETTYFTQDATGKLLILGYSNTHEYTTPDSDGVDQVGTSTNYNDANWNWLGSSWDDYYGSGYNSNVVVDGVRIDSGNFVSYAFDSEGARIEEGGEPEISDVSSYEYHFDVATGKDARRHSGKWPHNNYLWRRI